MSDFDRQVQRNLLGIDLEKAGRADEAIHLRARHHREL